MGCIREKNTINCEFSQREMWGYPICSVVYVKRGFLGIRFCRVITRKEECPYKTYRKEARRYINPNGCPFVTPDEVGRSESFQIALKRANQIMEEQKKLNHCQYCGSKLDGSATKCVNCGAPR